MSSGSVPYAATPQQRTVITASAQSRLYVEAGPGTGKTKTLIERMRYLVEEEQVPAGAGLLVLSFSVAAVDEVVKRLKESATDGSLPSAVRFAEVRTFDSFATRLLLRFVPSETVAKWKYDERIKEATALLTRADVRNSLRGLRHVLVDEIQDLVGVRADLVTALLKGLSPGFTLFGDRAQGIYDFQLKKMPGATTSAAFLDRLRTDFGDLRDTEPFTRNFRTNGSVALASISEEGRPLVIAGKPEAWKYLAKRFGALPSAGKGASPDAKIIGTDGSCCLMCAENGQLLRLGKHLREAEIPFQIARRRHENTAPPWIGRMFFGCQAKKLGSGDFVRLAVKKLDMEEKAAAALWAEFCISLGMQPSAQLEFRQIREGVVAGTVFPDPFMAPPPRVLLSTVHRSKGREYDDVVVLEDPAAPRRTSKGEKPDMATHARVLFVAMTRARVRLRRMEPVSSWGLERGGGDRWLRWKKMGSFNGLTGIEAGAFGDIDPGAFAAGEPEDVEWLQGELAERIKPGDEIELLLDRREGACGVYAILRKKTRIGMMSLEFGWALWHAIRDVARINPRKLPTLISGLWVRAVTTETGDLSSQDIAMNYKTSGLWLGLRIEGLGDLLEWKEP